MSVRSNFRRSNHDAVAVLDELIVFGIVIILFSSGIAMCSGFVKMYNEQNGANELYDKASDIAFRLMSSDRLIFKGQIGLFHSQAILDIDYTDLTELVTIPLRHELTVLLADLNDERYNTMLTTNRFSQTIILDENSDRAVVSYPVNLRLNELEVHAAKLTVILER